MKNILRNGLPLRRVPHHILKCNSRLSDLFADRPELYSKKVVQLSSGFGREHD